MKHLCLLCLLFITISVSAADQPLKVFILAGQSNMEGHGIVPSDFNRNGGQGSLEFMAKESDKKQVFQHTLNQDGTWKVREDVWICYLERKGWLTTGFGGNSYKIGPEFQFGHVVGHHLEEPVLLIKTAWGGKSLAVDFRPPSAGGETGAYYTKMLEYVHAVLSDLPAHVPNYKGKDYVLCGFGWHQGWNDRINNDFNAAYEENMAHFINDVRKEFNSPKLPFVIAETGMSGIDETHPRALSLMKAQAAVVQRPEFKGNVSFVGTKEFYRPKELSPSGQAYHWNTNAETYFLIGDALGKAMLDLQGK